MTKLHPLSAVGAAVIATMLSATFTVGSAQPLSETHLKVVGTFGSLRQFDLIEQPYFTTIIPERSGGRFTVDLVSADEFGLKGYEVMRLMKQGMLDIADASTQYVGGDEPFVEGLDLGFNNVEEAHKAFNAYKPLLDERLQKKFNVKLLTLWPFAAQIPFCRDPIASIHDLKGRRIRVAGRNIGGIMKYIGAVPVTIGAGEVYQALERGVVDCAITGASGGNTQHLYEVSTYLYDLPISWASAMHIVNLELWQRMSPRDRDFLELVFKEMEDKLWDFAGSAHQDGINCNIGVESCKYGFKGKMKVVNPSPADIAIRDEAQEKSLLPDWAERCGSDCIGPWNETIGRVIGVQATFP